MPEQSEILGVYAQFSLYLGEDNKKTRMKKLHNQQLKHYLWGEDGQGGLSAKLKKLSYKNYDTELKLILLQFISYPEPNWPKPKEIDNYRPKDQSIGVWITLDSDYFLRNEKEREAYIKDIVIQRLRALEVRFKARKFAIDMNRLIQDFNNIQ